MDCLKLQEGLLTEDTLAYASMSAMEKSAVSEGEILLKVFVPPELAKLMKFQLHKKISQIMESICERIPNLSDLCNNHDDDHTDYGIFVNTTSSGFFHGWLKSNKTLADYCLKTWDIIEFRPKSREIKLKGLIGSTSEQSVFYNDTLSIADNIPQILMQIGTANVPFTGDASSGVELGLLDKDLLLLQLPLPFQSQFLVTRNAPIKYDTPPEQIKSLCSFHIWLPYKKGYLHKKGDIGLVKTWKKRWFSLEGDKLLYYKSKDDYTPINFVSLSNVEQILLTNKPFDATSKKDPEACFQVIIPGRIYHLKAENQVSQNDWTDVLQHWFSLKEFFGPDRKSTKIFFKESTIKGMSSREVPTRARKITPSSEIIKKAGASFHSSDTEDGYHTHTSDEELIAGQKKSRDGRERMQEIPEEETTQLPINSDHIVYTHDHSSSNIPSPELEKRKNREAERNKEEIEGETQMIAGGGSMLLPFGTAFTPLVDPFEDDLIHSQPLPQPHPQPQPEMFLSEPEEVDDFQKVEEREEYEEEEEGEEADYDTEIRLLLTDGSIQPLIIDANVDIYDLVYAVANEIGSSNAHLISSFDHDEFRQVELLDHQKSLAEQHIPEGAMFLMKKTGIIDDYIGPDDIYDNHFLYVQLPKLEGTLLMNDGDASMNNPAGEEDGFV
eukprot:CAMPEP_0174251030 /NCGR_PEP_ID=MMETSP0439-20130205/999_1 /TAXON_ID=0 /ORGANISM="Stereomyxa ramosa, Strain Chinc5" /LENGTH=666 /DNA_ID=CAMNT_0015331253 /DNA_START=35 /DNA_END=2036 /DNA_ORIENTATION=+